MIVYTADKHNRSDGSAHTMCQNINSKYPIVIVSWVENFIFNDALLNVKDYVLVCFAEYGWNYEITDSHIWGTNTDKNGYGDGRYKGEEWDKFDNWVKENPFKVMFKRELLSKDRKDNVYPIEYPCIVNEFSIQSENEFNSRPINVFQYWGRSNEERLRIHSEIWLHAYNKGFQPCDNLYYINYYLQEERGEKWITLWLPHYARIDVNELLKINNLSKLSLSWMGAGFKCFRTAEAPTSSIMVMNRNNFAWTFNWDETNCILVDKGKEIEQIEMNLQRTDLYQVYKNGVENSKNYRPQIFYKHIEEIINKA